MSFHRYDIQNITKYEFSNILSNNSLDDLKVESIATYTRSSFIHVIGCKTVKNDYPVRNIWTHFRHT